MTPDVRPLVAGNWKMNGTRASLDQIKAIAEGVQTAAFRQGGGADLPAGDAALCRYGALHG